MALETQKKIIDGKTYHISPFMPLKGVVLQAKLLKIIAPAIAAAASDKKGAVNILDNVDLSLVAQKLFESLDADGVEALILDLLSNTVGESDIATPLSNPTVFNREFEQDYKRLYTLIYHVLEVNFKTFLLETFGDLIGKGEMKKKLKPQKSDSQESAN